MIELTGTVVSIDDQENPFSSYEVIWDGGFMSNTFLCKRENSPKLGDKATLTFSKNEKEK